MPPSQPYQVLTISPDRGQLWLLSRFLCEFGYAPLSAANLDHGLALLDRHSPDFQLLDLALGRQGCLDLCHAATRPDRSVLVYTCVLAARPGREELVELLRAGARDVLASPVVFGEMLGRLRAGARALEFDRRLRELSGVDLPTGLPNRTACLEQLQGHLLRAEEDGRPVACVLWDAGVRPGTKVRTGREPPDKLPRNTADLLRNSLSGQYLASFGDGRFSALLPDCDIDQAATWAEEVRERLAAIGPDVAGRDRNAVSAGVASSDGGKLRAVELVQRAEEALEDARNSGQDCTVRWGERATEARKWAELGAPGRMFQDSVARDVMVPCPAVLRTDDTASRAAALMRQTRQEAVPVVDANGQLVGVMLDHVPQCDRMAQGDARQPVREIMSKDVPHFEGDVPFGTLMDYFIREPKPLVVITHGGRPVGLVGRNGLASIIDPLSTASFRMDAPSSLSSEWLLVPDVGSL